MSSSASRPGRRPDPSARRLWQERLERFRQSGLTTSAFCDREGVSTPSFYAWRRRLRIDPPAAADSPRFLPVQVLSSPQVELVLPCGAGKTIVGIGCMAKLSCSTLILTTSTTAVRQWISELLDKTTLQPDGTTYAFSLSREGGTSVAAPTFAGIEADAQQAAGHDIGFADPAIYQRYRTGAFPDVTDHPRTNTPLAVVRGLPTAPSLRLFGDGVDLHATAGYDNATGVGSPNGRYLASFR